MSFENALQSFGTQLAGADLSAKQYYATKLNSSGAVVLAEAGQHCVGILQNKPESGQVASVGFSGVSKAIAGGNIDPGMYVAANADGKLVNAAEAIVDTQAGSATDPVIGSNVLGIALSSAVSGDIFAVLLTHSGAVPTTAA
jgi:hypothetical protein